jgi:cytochrome c biogenesis protein CcmG, thiol:disulfide interchange protein DsbE
MRRALLPLLIFAFLIALLIVGLRHAPEKDIIASPLIGKPAPAYHAPNLADPTQPVTEQDLHGQWHLLNVWGTWCVSCSAEHPALMAIQQEGRVPIVGLDWKDNDADALAWLARLGNPYQIVATDHDGRIAIDYGVYAAPESFLINPAGFIVEKQVGEMTLKVWRSKFLPHLNTAAGSKVVGGKS